MDEMNVQTLDGQSLVATLRQAADGAGREVAISNIQGDELAVLSAAQLLRASRFLQLPPPRVNPSGRAPRVPSQRVPARMPGRQPGELGPVEVARLKTFASGPER